MTMINLDIEISPTDSDDIEAEDTFNENSSLIVYSGEIQNGLDSDLINFICSNAKIEADIIHLLLCTPGGDPDCAYLIARKLNRLFKEFNIIVNGYCKSAGTLLALGSNRLIITDEAEFGPLDVQIFSPDEFMKRSSGLTITQATKWINNQVFESFEEFFLSLRTPHSLILSWEKLIMDRA